MTSQKGVCVSSHVFFFPQCEEKKLIDDLITKGIEEGLEVQMFFL